jgi:predicted ATPase
MGHYLLLTGKLADARAHYNQALALYDPNAHRALGLRFGQDPGMTVLSHRSWVLWLLGYPDAALADMERMLKGASEIGQAATLLQARCHAAWLHIFCGDYVEANALLKELVALADEKGAPFWKGAGIALQGFELVLTGHASEAVGMILAGITALRSTGATVWVVWYLLILTAAYAELGQLDDARRCMGDAMTAVASKETWCEAEVDRVAGELALIGPTPDAAKAEASFERALLVARQQQAKSWELRATVGLARLWRDQGKVRRARELLAPVYGWFTEGFDTLDLKEAKALLDELAA